MRSNAVEYVSSRAEKGSEKFTWLENADMYAIYEWVNSRGHYFQEEEMYDTYDIDMLVELAGQGDGIASEGESPELLIKRDEALLQTVTYGSTYALKDMVSVFMHSSLYDMSISDADRRQLKKASIAYLTVAERRNDGDATIEKIIFLTK